MKITSRQSPTVQGTPIDVRDLKIDCDVTYGHQRGYYGATQKEFYVEMVIRIPLSNADTADIQKLGERMKKLRQAQLLEVK